MIQKGLETCANLPEKVLADDFLSGGYFVPL